MLCEKCGAFFGKERAPVPVFCHRCNDHKYRRARALGVYEKALASAVIELKHRPFLPGRVKDRIHEFLTASDFVNVDVLVPVPLSLQRYQERGFNQAEIIARVIGTSLNVPVDALSLTRSVHTPLHRGGMDQKAREFTVRKAFKVTRPKFIHGKRVLLIDDVFTSGATASACADIVLRSGAVDVNVFTLARAVFR